MIPFFIGYLEAEAESRMVVARAGGEGMWNYCLFGTVLHFGKMKKSWRRIVVMVVQLCECT